jgi:hypothetical protein
VLLSVICLLPFYPEIALRSVSENRAPTHQPLPTVEESFAREAQVSGASLPIRVDEITTLTGIEAEGRTLRLIFDVSEDIPALAPGFEATLADYQCQTTMFGSELSRGGMVVMIYRGPGGRMIDTFTITDADCGS